MRLSRFQKTAVVAVGILLGVPMAYVGFLCITYIDDEVMTGEAYGFTIGQSKVEAYQAAGDLFDRNEIVAIDTVMHREEETTRFPESQGYYHVAETATWFDRWNHWELHQGGKMLAIISFEGDVVAAVGLPQRMNSRWCIPDISRTIWIAEGQTYDEVYRILLQLARLPGYEDLQITTGWMARKQPTAFRDGEFCLVSSCDFWDLLIDEEHGYFNSIELTFYGDRLTKIHRHRQYFELP